MPTFGSLFAGIGGMDLGLERAGWTVRWQVEIDPLCQRVLAKHWPDVPRYGDIRTLTGAELERVDLIAGGFPCQPVSEAGQRRGTADPRWLWPEFWRVVRALQPGLIFVENTPGLLDRGMGDVLGAVATGGYDAAWDVFPAAAAGAPHLRERVFIVAASRAMVDSGVKPARCFAGPEEVWWRAPISGVRPRLPGSPWATEPELDRVAHGIPHSMDRRRALGNAVVPQVAEWIGRRLLAVMEG